MKRIALIAAFALLMIAAPASTQTTPVQCRIVPSLGGSYCAEEALWDDLYDVHGVTSICRTCYPDTPLFPRFPR